MEIFTWLSILVILTIIYIWWDLKRKRDFPPGPMNTSLSRMQFLLKNRTELVKYVENYGGICTFTIYTKIFIVLTSWESVKETILMNNNEFSDKPKIFHQLDKNMENKEILSASGPVNKEKRRFVIYHLRSLGFGKSSMETIILSETSQLIALLDQSDGQEVQTSKLFHLPILNVLWGIIAGKSFDYEDEKMKQYMRFLEEKQNLIVKALPVSFMPMLRFLPGDPFCFWKMTERIRIELQHYDREIEDHINSYEPDNPRDFIDIYLANIFKQSASDKLQETCFDKLHLRGTLFSLFNAGLETTSTTLEWAILYFATWPVIQEKIQLELDDVVGRHRKPSIQDRPLLPYTEATIMEIQRFTSTVSMTIAKASKTSTVMGYKISKGTDVIRSLFAIHHNKTLWGDPEVFRPERFINEEGKVFKPEYFIPFSNGERQCIAEQMTRMELFLFITSLLQHFTFSYSTGKKPPSLQPSYLALPVLSKPENYSVLIKRRLY